jgi:sulfane dehydrogenase subunit SoxC
MKKEDRISRRLLLKGAAGTLGASALARAGLAQEGGPPDPTKVPGRPLTEVGQRSAFEQPTRILSGPYPQLSATPLQDLTGIVTPTDLHFGVTHNGVPAIDPQFYKLIIHGMVERPMVFDLEALKRFPAVTRLHFLECAGNGSNGFHDIQPNLTPQLISGLMSTNEWTGVSLATLLREVGVRPGASWFLAEGGDAGLVSRSIPLAKGLDDAMIAYGQNGEALRPEQGYPARLFLPGWEGNTNIKWIRRIEVVDRPFMTRFETSRYTDPLLDGTARQFSFVMDANSIITFPSSSASLPDRGWWEISGLAWSGRGRITRVDVTTDGQNWRPAILQDPVLPKCHTRFRYLWNWDGRESLLASRAVDETGYVQPTVTELRKARGLGTKYHYNNILVWRVRPDGSVVFALAS